MYDIEIPSIANFVSAGTAPTTISFWSWISANALSLADRITLTSRAGTILADIPNCGMFGNIVSATCTKASDLATKTTLGNASVASKLYATQAAALLQPVGD